MRNLRENQAIVVLTADKGGKVVVLNSTVYSAMCLVHLEDPSYQLVNEFGTGRSKVRVRGPDGSALEEFSGSSFADLDQADLLLKLQCRKLTELLTSLKNRGQMSVEDRKKTIPSQPFSGTIPHLYGSPKIHKIGTLKIRPIISNVNNFCDKLLLHLKPILNIVFRSDFSVLNSYKFVEKLEQLELSKTDRLASFDVESLFTKVPVGQTVDIVRIRLERLRETEQGRDRLDEVTSLTNEGVLALLRLVTMDFYFTWAGQLYRQISGLPMGSRLSPILANIFMEEVETSVLTSLCIRPKLYVRYVDDIFIIYDSQILQLQQLLLIFNSQHPDIRLTCEMEQNEQLPFLDLLIRRINLPQQETTHLDIAIYRKPTHSHRYLNFSSSHPLSQKREVLSGLLLRAHRLLRHFPQNLNREMNYLHRTFTSHRNGYPVRLVRRWVANFTRRLRENPGMLDFRNRNRTREGGQLQENPNLDINIEENPNLDVADANFQNREQQELKRVLLVPYIPGLSDRLKTIAARYQVKSWFLYRGRLGDGLSSSYKDQTHVSKKKDCVYRARCSCGECYIGETNRNLKVRMSEHKGRSSASSLSSHLRLGMIHQLEENSTEIVLHERHMPRRKFLESLAILHGPDHLCNVGPSADVSQMWFGCIPALRSALE